MQVRESLPAKPWSILSLPQLELLVKPPAALLGHRSVWLNQSVSMRKHQLKQKHHYLGRYARSSGSRKQNVWDPWVLI